MGGTKAIVAASEANRHILARHVVIIRRDGRESIDGGMAGKRIGTTEK